jgi:hypothetical protein
MPKIRTGEDRPAQTNNRADGPRTGVSASDEHHRSTSGPHWTNKDQRPTHVSAGQALFDLARPKGFEPLTF